MLKGLARLILRIGGWTAIGSLPQEPKAIFIAAPHTSNWDGFWALTYKTAVGLDVHFFAKDTLFWFPLGNLLRSLGGIPLDRSKATSAVSQAVAMFNSNESFYFGLAPEGTRSLRESWKTGFYRIAKEANVPLYGGIIDYSKKHIGVGGRIELTDDVDADLARCADFYSDSVGRCPAKASPIRFKS
jgi:1-acyl-sn-glycerol-3-phosphate acyltransferase